MKPNMLQKPDNMPASDDRRIIVRSPHLDDGRLLFAGSSELDCVIQDFHGGGARITLNKAIDVPWEDLALQLMARGIVFPATKVWQSEHEIGLRFVGNAWAA